MTRMSAPIVLTVIRDFDAPAERVFAAWTNPGDAARFLFSTSDGELIRCDMDVRVGGGFTIVERRATGEAAHLGKYVEIAPPHRLVFLFAATPADAEAWTRVTVEIVERDTGCTLTLTHEMDPQWAAFDQQTRKGWTMILASLSAILEP